MSIKNLLKNCLHIFNDERPNPVVKGRIRMESDGHPITDSHYNKKLHRDAIIAQALSEHKKVEIYITPYEQQKGRWMVIDNGSSDNSNIHHHFNSTRYRGL